MFAEHEHEHEHDPTLGAEHEHEHEHNPAPDAEHEHEHERGRTSAKHERCPNTNALPEHLLEAPETCCELWKGGPNHEVQGSK